MDNGQMTRLAELAVGVGANVQPDQIVVVGSEPGKEPLTRAVAEAAYKAGAKFVDVSWFDPYVKRARIAYAPDDSLEFVPDWYGQRALALGDVRAARIGLAGSANPGVLDGLDPKRAGRDRLPAIKENSQVLSERTTNWTIVPCPNEKWAALVHPDLEPEAALAKLWEQVAYVCRLDEPDPGAAWAERVVQLATAASRLDDRQFDALHYTGPGTDLTIGLLPQHSWISGSMETVDGIRHMANLPTEEVFTSPDPQRAEGVVSATLPLVLVDGTVVRDLVMHFEDGAVVELTASSGEDVMRAIVARDAGACRLGECALVDREGRIGALETIFYDTLLDENAASHLAIGVGFPFAVADEFASRVNVSEVHLDFMIGGPQVDVTGITHDGERVPALMGGDWKL
ncbi:MAG: aminopeptidase [Solirubrobacteraceae bacterium]|jgi:aminopeptidase|nr:aminopeptidase [Baekduia sp.]MEA2167280.1 aminopeptidase [Solirubrobacteraceae bacterium]